jgi:hypothetical protein
VIIIREYPNLPGRGLAVVHEVHPSDETWMPYKVLIGWQLKLEEMALVAIMCGLSFWIDKQYR